MQNQDYLFGRSWETLPSPKIRRIDRSGAYGWTRLYTGFSESFASEAIALLSASRADVVLDPFAGAGTTLLAAQQSGRPSIGIEIDPFTALLARAALAVSVDGTKVMAYLRPRRRRGRWQGNEGATEIFAAADLRYCSAVFQAITESRLAASWASILAEPRFDSEAIALAALILSATTVASVTRGSNPVWIRRLRKGERKETPPLSELARANAARLVRDVQARWAQYSSLSLARATLVNSDFREVRTRSMRFNIVLTSPPYLNRVDYVINHMAELQLLSGVVPIDFERLRRRMLGTTKMVARPEPAPEWGVTCLNVLDAIRNHPSKASATYYYRFHTQYFRDSFAAIRALKRAARSHARGAIIVQDSYYKELRIPLAAIWCEMCAAFNIDTEIVRTEPIRSHIGRMSPKQNSYAPTKILEENIIALRF